MTASITASIIHSLLLPKPSQIIKRNSNLNGEKEKINSFGPLKWDTTYTQISDIFFLITPAEDDEEEEDEKRDQKYLLYAWLSWMWTKIIFFFFLLFYVIKKFGDGQTGTTWTDRATGRSVGLSDGRPAVQLILLLFLLLLFVVEYDFLFL